jgi:hypothetical protein
LGENLGDYTSTDCEKAILSFESFELRISILKAARDENSLYDYRPVKKGEGCGLNCYSQATIAGGAC